MDSDLRISVDSQGLGDILNITPVIRKLSNVATKLDKKLSVYVNKPDLLKNNPYCDVFQKDLFEKTDNSFEIIVQSDNRFMFMKSNQISQLNVGGCNIIDYNSIQCGFTLSPHEKSLDYFPDPSDIFKRYDIPDNYLVMNPSITWPSRTWDKNKWQRLINLCNDKNIFVVLVGRGIENASQDDINNLEVGTNIGLNLSYGLDLQNKTSLDDVWNLLDRADCLICTDSGIMHIAGTTDVQIILLPGSINPYHRLPFRNGSQDYKTEIVYGECKIFCASSIAYNKLVHNTFTGTPPIDTCLEGFDSFLCHSKPDDVFSLFTFEENKVINNINTQECNITYRFENNITDINHEEVSSTKKIWIMFWDSLGDIVLSFKDTSGNIPEFSYNLSIKSEGEFWFDVAEVFSNYDNFKIEVNKDNDVLYSKILK